MCRLTTRSRGGAEQLKKEDKWVEDFDVVAFTADIKALGDELEKQQGDADVRHLNKMIGWSNACAAVGLLTMGLGVNFVSVFALSTWTFTRWTMIAHTPATEDTIAATPTRGGGTASSLPSVALGAASMPGSVSGESYHWHFFVRPLHTILQSIVKIIDCRT